MSTTLTQREALRAPLALGLGHPCGPSAAGSWHVRICGRRVLSDRLPSMPKLAFAPEVNA